MFSGEVDFTYVYSTDAQSDLKDYSSVIYTKDGYYQSQFMESEGILMDESKLGRELYYYDNQLAQQILVCSKTNCPHDGAGCDGFFSEKEYPTLRFWYYKDALYCMKLEGDYLYIERVSGDGSVRKKSCTLMRQVVESKLNEDGSESTSYYIPEIQIHRGYAYFSDYYIGCESTSLYRVKLDSEGEAEILFTLTENPTIYRIKPYGRYVLFQMGNYSVDFSKLCGEIYAYDTENGTISRISEGAIWDYCMLGQALYYFDLQNNIMKKDLVTGETTLFYQNERECVLSPTRLFPYEDNLIFVITDLNTNMDVQLIIDENGVVTSTLEEASGDTLLHPYTFE